MRLTRVLPIAAVLFALACTSADVLQLDPTPRPKTSPNSIQLIGQEPKRPYTVIAIVSTHSETGGGGAERVRARLIKEAARLGGHAVLVDANSLTRVGTGGEYGGTNVQLSGKVIVYTDTTRADSSRSN